MSLRIKHLNADSSFLLIFSPPWAPHNPQGTFPGSFTILIDPWLSGPSKILHDKFALTNHVENACVESVAELPDPDLVLVSQDKPDHCHEETLHQLPPDTSATILGPPGAAKRIRSWDHFDPLAVQSLRRYEDKRDDSIHRIPIPPFSPSGSPGEVTVSHLAPRVDLMGIHNAIGITYRPPSSVLSVKTGSYVSLPLTPPTTPPASPPTPTRPITATTSSSPASPLGNREKAISVIYTPHGVDYGVVKPYAVSHLLAEAALPLTALFHSFDRSQNPWYFGGNVTAGTPGGLEIARNLFAKVWISAHDEDKDNTGWSVRGLKTTKYQVEDIKRMIEEEGAKHATKQRPSPQLLSLEAGEEHMVGPG